MIADPTRHCRFKFYGIIEGFASFLVECCYDKAVSNRVCCDDLEINSRQLGTEFRDF